MPPPKTTKDAVRGSPAPSRQRATAHRAMAGREYDAYTLPMLLDRVLVPPATGGSCESMCYALLALRERVAGDPTNIGKVGGKLAERSNAWTSFLARVIHDEQNRIRRPAIATISWLMAQLVPLASTDATYQLFILNQRFLQILTLVTEAPVVEIAQTILHCCQSQQIIETVVRNNEMANILRVSIERLAQLGPQFLDSCTAMVMLAANLIGRHPVIAQEMVGAHIDELLCQVGLRNISNLGLQMGVVTQRAVLYCLRFFVRIRRESIPFCQSCLSMCAHSIQALPNESTDLCGDVCAVMNNPPSPTLARNYPNVYLNVVALATRMPNMSRAHFVFRLLKGILPMTDSSLVGQYSEFGLAAAMKLCRIGWIDSVPAPEPKRYRKDTVAELLDLLVACTQSGSREQLASRINSSVMALLRDSVVANVKENRQHLVKFVQILMYFTLPAPVTGLCKFWMRLSPFIESRDLTVAEYNSSHPNVTPYDPQVTVPAEARMEAYLEAILQQLGHFETLESTARAKVRDSYVADLNILLDAVVAQRSEILSSRSEIEFRLIDSAARSRLNEMRTVIAEEHQRFRAERTAEMTFAKQQLFTRHDTVMRLAADFAKGETDEAQLPPHELADMRIYHRKVTDRIRKGLRVEREAQLSEVRWHACQGNHLRHLLRSEYVDSTKQSSILSHIQVQEEIVRGYGWYNMVRFRADEDADVVSNQGSNQHSNSVAGSRPGLPSAGGGGGGAGGSFRRGDSNRSSVASSAVNEFQGIITMPLIPIPSSESYVSIVEEEEHAWYLLRGEIDAIIARTRRTSIPREEEVTDALESQEEVERFIIQEDNWRAYMLMREELEFDNIAEQWRTGVPLTVEELEQRGRAVTEDKAMRWLSATMGLLVVMREEESRRAFINTNIYNIKSWAERFELLWRATIEVEECRSFHVHLVQWKEREMRAMLSKTEHTERRLLEDMRQLGANFPAELLFWDARLEPDLAGDMDPFAWPIPMRDTQYRRPSSFHGNAVRRSGSSRSLSLVSDSLRAASFAAASASLRDDGDVRPTHSNEVRDKKKRQQT